MAIKTDFHKYQGLGNDFILFDAVNKEAELLAALSPSVVQSLCRRKYGIGADGIILLTSSEQADFAMRLFNADGSEAELSGNGLRCLALFAHNKKLTGESCFTIQTGGGVSQVEIINAATVKVEMPSPEFECDKIPMLWGNTFIEQKATFAGGAFKATALAVGNPHCVILSKFSLKEIYHWGPIIEKSPYFPKGVNVGFAEVKSADTMELRVWERGVGLTEACGSGAAAAVCAAVKTGRIACDRPVSVIQKGGELTILVTQGFKSVHLSGEAVFVFSGEIII